VIREVDEDGWHRLPVADFDLSATLDSGQIFHWSAHEWAGKAGFLGTVGNLPVFLAQDGEMILARSAEELEAAIPYFGLGHELGAIKATFPADDPHLAAAVAFSPGLRICLQPKWECLATFITSSLKQVPHIRQISLRLRERFGIPLRSASGAIVHGYPEPSVIGSAGEAELRACGLGYRAKGLHLAAERIACGEISLDALESRDDDEVRESLRTLHGVGEKIANCTLLFAYGRLGAFPVDVWIGRVLRELYFRRRRKPPTDAELKRFVARHFGAYAGYSQQYLFHFARKNARKGASFPPSSVRPPMPTRGRFNSYSIP
jgi:N-glycosylase/DNA lyase